MNTAAPILSQTSNLSTTPYRVATQLRQLAERTLWVNFGPEPTTGVHNFTPDLLAEFQKLIGDMKIPAGAAGRGVGHPPPYAVIQSSHPTYFSQGGDLRFFLSCIQRRDAEKLREYSMTCLDAIHAWSTSFKSDMTTISLVQGRALGGGFELALSADYIIAEEQSDFGFPEIMFGLFPCTGAMSLLCERVSPRQAERMMTQKKMYKAGELLEMGIIDEVCKQGSGELAVERFIQQHASRRKSRMKMRQASHRRASLDYAEGRQVVNDWVEVAMQLGPDEIRAMEMLIMMQVNEQPETARPLKQVA
ncbi:crotonase/enoyl-CoA hydratase family protein [Luteimonas sp. RIT-PG2_3]